jgi:hypothetical protein
VSRLRWTVDVKVAIKDEVWAQLAIKARELDVELKELAEKLLTYAALDFIADSDKRTGEPL